MLVLPAPVGAHTSKLSGDLNAFSYNLDYITLSVVIPYGKALWVHSGIFAIGISFSSDLGTCRIAGTLISS